jgi:hypothetical protein
MALVVGRLPSALCSKRSPLGAIVAPDNERRAR